MEDPECRVDDGVVLLRGADFKPDSPEARNGLEAGRGNVALVVPDEAAVPSGMVGRERGRDERHEKENATACRA
jgi:hypothetical protein